MTGGGPRCGLAMTIRAHPPCPVGGGAARCYPRAVTKFYKTPWFRAGLAWLAAGYLRFAAATQIWRVEGEENIRLLAGDAPMIAVFWHETLPSMYTLWPRARRLGMRRPTTALASRHRDGQLIGEILHHFGIGLVSGSSSRGGAQALRLLVEQLKGGAHVVITPDGPRGPRRAAAPGVAAAGGPQRRPGAALRGPGLARQNTELLG